MGPPPEDSVFPEGLSATALDAIPILVGISTTDGRYRYVNQASSTLLGYRPEQLVGRTFREVGLTLPEHAGEQVRSEIAARGSIDRRAVRLRHADGSIVTLLVSGLMVELSGERCILWIGQDITTQQRAAESLQRSEARISAIIESAPIGIAEVDDDGVFRDVNPAFALILQRPHGAIVGRSFQEFTHPDDIASSLEIQRELLEHPERTIRFTKRYLTPDGATHWAELVVFHASQSDSLRPIRIVIASDVTEQRRTSAELELLDHALHAAANGVVITDRTGTIVWANHAVETLTGYALDELLGQSTKILKSGRHDAAFYAELWGTVSSGRVWSGALTNRRKDGSEYDEEMTITPVRGTDGSIAHYIAVKLDITERRALEERLRQAQKLEAIGRLAGGVAHDFNNIITVVGTCVDLGDLSLGGLADAHSQLRALASDEQIPQALRAQFDTQLTACRTQLSSLRSIQQEQRHASQRATELTRQLLTFSRRVSTVRRPLRLSSVVHGAEQLLRRIVSEDVELVTDLAPCAGIILADATQLEQLLLNLVTNARDAMAHGGRVTIRTRDSPPHGPEAPSVVLTVEDTGAGMAPDVLRNAFEPFYTTKGSGHGTGLGLATVKSVVDACGGTIAVRSVPGQGTTFTITLPRTDTPVSEEPRRQLPAPSGNERVMLVEDEPSVRRIMQRALEGRGYTVFATEQPSTATSILRTMRGQLQLIVTDIVMPGMSGIDLAKLARQIDPQLRILYVTGYSDHPETRALLASHPDLVLEKPFSTDGFLWRVREVLDAPVR